MIRVGITGGIGSGKSTVCRIWEDAGVRVISADDVAKELMVTHPDIIKNLKETFGDDAYSPDGSLNRAYLANEAFAKGRVEELNNIVHPVMFAETSRLMDEAEGQGIEVCAKEAALLLKYGRPKDLDVVVLVRADQNKRVLRVAERDKVNEAKVMDRMGKQAADSELRVLSDIEITNDGSLADLERVSLQTLARIKETCR